MPISTIFHTILQMTGTASLCILAVLLIRLLLKKAPRVFSYALWSVVLFRLLCPFSFESVLSLIPSAQVVEPTGQAGLPFQVNTNIPVIDTPVNEYLGSHYYEGVTVPTDFSLDLSQVLGTIWLVGCMLLLGISLISFVRLRKKLRGAVWEEANIYHARGLETAFVLGVFRPKIYLPEGLSEKERRYILLHEQTHIRRKDYLIRLAAFAALCLHWFNPIVWLAFFVSSRDMEMSCDEAVLKKLGNEVKKDYSTSLLSLASGRRWVGGTPLAFGEGDTKSRIKNVLSYRKPAFWVLIAAVIAVAAAVFLLAANPLSKRESMRWLNSLNAADVQQIELVVMPSDENERYTLYTEESDISAVVRLLREGKGRYVANPEELSGGSISFFLTMKDGSRHSVFNNGNVYLVVDGDSYDANYNWLSSWDENYSRGDSPLPEDFSFHTVVSPFGQQYTVESILYRAPQYSADITEDNAPYYQITREGNLRESNDWILRSSDSGDWTDCGVLEKISLTNENFDQLFSFADKTIWKNGFSAQSLREDNQSAWKAVRENGENSILYYLLLQEDGSLFLTYGYENGENSNIRWVFQLYPEAQLQLDIAPKLFSLRTDYIGNNSAVGNLLDALDFPQTRGSFSLKTDAQPYGLTVNFAEDAPDLLPYEKNAVLLLALIDNADEIAYQFPSEALIYDRTWAEEWLEIPDVRVKSVEELSSLLDLLNGIVDGETIAQTSPDWGDYSYAGETSLRVGDRTFQLEDIPENPAEEAVSHYYAWSIAGDSDSLTALCSESGQLQNSVQNELQMAEQGEYIQSYIVYTPETLSGNTIPSQVTADAKSFGLTDYVAVRADVDMTYSQALAALAPQLEEGRYSRIFLCAEKNGDWKLYQMYWEESLSGYSNGINEPATLQYVLNNIIFTNGSVSFALPAELPKEHPLEIQASAQIADGAGGFTSNVDLFAEQNETGWEAGKTYSVLAAPNGWTEGSTVSMYLRFYEKPEENLIHETAGWYASWVYQDGQMVRQPWPFETTVQAEQQGRQWTLHYSEAHGREFFLTLTLPENWWIMPEDGMLTGGQANIFDELGQPMGTITQNAFTYYPEAVGDNFPISVYSELMLSSVTNWNNEYTPIKQGSINSNGIPVTETATVLIQHTDNGAAGPIIQMPGILSYNLDILRYIAISFTEAVSQESAAAIANSINLG